MLHAESAKTMLEAGATYADLAISQDVSLQDARQFCREHNLSEAPEWCTRRRRLARAQSPYGTADFERLFVDDQDGHVINGIDTRTTDGRVNSLEIIRHYHGDCRCYYSDEPTELAMSADGNQQNLLISNLVPITQKVLEERFDTFVATTDSHFQYKNFSVSLTIEHRFDKLLGSALNYTLVSDAMTQWVSPYADQFDPLTILQQYGLPGSPDLVALWVWRRLEKRALLKGLSRVKVSRETLPDGYVTKHQILHHTKQMLARQFGQRNVLTSEPAVVPPPGPRAAPRLIKL